MTKRNKQRPDLADIIIHWEKNGHFNLEHYIKFILTRKKLEHEREH